MKEAKGVLFSAYKEQPDFRNETMTYTTYKTYVFFHSHRKDLLKSTMGKPILFFSVPNSGT